MKTIVFKKTLWFTVITTLRLVFVGLFVTCSCDKHEKSEIKYVKTELGARQFQHGDKDTTIITASKDFIDIVVGIASIPCKWNPFETEVEIIDDVLYMRIIDSCPDPSGCHMRCPSSLYYTFDFIFKYQGKINQKYKVLLRAIQIHDDMIYDNTKILSEGIITNTNP